MSGLLAPPAIDRNGTGPAHGESHEACQIEQNMLVADGPELYPVLGDLGELHREESVGQMDREERGQQDDRKRHAGKRDEASDQYEKAADQLCQGCGPGEEERGWYAKRMQNDRKRLGTAAELRVAVRDEAISDDETKRQRAPRRNHVSGSGGD